MQYVHTLGCKISFASVAHPQSNGQAERANAEVLRGLKARTFDTLQKHGRRWIEELPVVLWSLGMTPNRATGQTPFSLVYGAEAVIPTELIYGSPRVLAYDEVAQDRHRRDDVVLLEENRLWADVIQVMLFHWILPCQLRPLHMWEFNPEGPRTLQRFFGTMHEEI